MTESVGKSNFLLDLDKTPFDSKLTAAESQAQKSSSIMGGHFSKMLGAAGIGGAIAGSALIIGSAFNNMDTAMQGLQAQTGATDSQIGKLRDVTNSLYESNLQGVGDIAKVEESLITLQGVSADDSATMTDLTGKYLKFSEVAGGDVVTNTDAMGQALKAWNIPAAQSGEIMDKLTVGHQRFGTAIGPAMAALTSEGPTFQGLGLSINDSLGYINMFTQAGVDAGSASMAFNKELKALTDTSAVGVKHLEDIAAKLGMTTEATQQLMAANPAEQFKILQAALAGVEDPARRSAAAIDLFGPRAGAKMAEAFHNTAGSMDQFTISTEAAAGATEKASDRIESSFTNKLKILSHEVIGTLVDKLGFLGGGFQALGAVAGSLGALSQLGMMLMMMGPMLFGAKAGTDALAVSQMGLGASSGEAAIGEQVLTDVNGEMAVSEDVVAASATAADVALLPLILTIGLVIVAAAAMALAGYEIYKHWDLIVGFFNDTIMPLLDSVANTFDDTFGGILDYLKEYWPLLLGILLGPLGLAIGAFILWHDQIIGFVKDIPAKIGDGINAAIDVIESLPKATIGALQDILNFAGDHWREIAAILSGPFFPLVALATDAFGIRSALIGSVDDILGFFSEHWPEIATILSGPFAPLVILATDSFGLRSKLEGAITGMITFVEGAIDTGIHFVEDTFIGGINVIETAVTGFVNWVTTAVTDVVGFFTALPGNVMSVLSSLPTDMYALGHDIIQGLLDGALSVFPEVLQFFEDLPNQILHGIEYVLGISSPSTVFYQIGIDILQGLLNGALAGVPALLGLFAGLPGMIFGAIGDLAGQFLSYGAKLVGSMVSGVTGAIGAGASAIGGAISGAVGLLGTPPGMHELPDQYATYGTGLVANLATGVAAGTPAAIDAASALAKALNPLHSPPGFEVTADGYGDYGKNIPEAVGAGLSAGEQSALDALQALGNQMRANGADMGPQIAADWATTGAMMPTAAAEALNTGAGDVAAAAGNLASSMSVATAAATPSVDPALAAIDKAQKIIGLVSSGVQALNSLSTYKGMTVAVMQQFSNDYVAGINIFAAAIGGGAGTIDKATDDWTVGAGKLMGLVSTGAQAFAALDKYKGMAAATFQSFASDYVVAVNLFTNAIGPNGQIPLTDAASKWAEGAGKVMGLVSTGVSALMSLNNYKGFVDSTMETFAHDWVHAAAVFIGAVGGNDPLVDSAMTWAEGAGKVMALVGTGVTALTDLAKYKGILPGVMDGFAHDWVHAAAAFIGALGGNDPLVDATMTWAEGAGKIMGLVAGGVAAFAALDKYKGVVPATVALFTADYLLAAKLLTHAFAGHPEIKDATIAWAEGAGKIVGLITSGVAAFISLDKYKGVAPGAMMRFALDYVLGATLFAKDIHDAKPTVDDAAATWADSAGKLYAAIGAGLTVLENLKEPAYGSKEIMERVVALLTEAVVTFGTGMAGLSTKAQDAIGPAATAGVNIVKGIGDLLTILVHAQPFAQVSLGVITQVTDTLVMMVKRFAAGMAGISTDSMTAASTMATVATNIAGAISTLAGVKSSDLRGQFSQLGAFLSEAGSLAKSVEVIDLPTVTHMGEVTDTITSTIPKIATALAAFSALNTGHAVLEEGFVFGQLRQMFMGAEMAGKYALAADAAGVTDIGTLADILTAVMPKIKALEAASAGVGTVDNSKTTNLTINNPKPEAAEESVQQKLALLSQMGAV